MPVLLLKNQKKNVGKLEICNQTEISADLNIFGDIVSDDWGKWCDDDTCPSDISDFLKNLEDIQEINLHINSGGGSVFAGITIYNMLKRNNARITTYIDGIAASIASVIACAGDRIVIPANGTFMIHKPTNGYFFTSMNADQLRKDADTLDICQKAILQTYMSKTKEGVTEEEINNLINEETWMVGSDTTDYFDFEVEDSVQAAACASNYFDEYSKTPRVTENNLIMDAIKTKKEVKLSGLDDIKKVLNVTLGSAFKQSSKIITNDDGLQYLDTLKDTNGRYLLAPDPKDTMQMRLAVGGTYIQVEVIPNEDLSSTPTYAKTTDTDVKAGKIYYKEAEGVYTEVEEPKKAEIAGYFEISETKIPIIIGDLKEGIWYFDRAKTTIMTSNIASIGTLNAFEEDLTIYRAIEREDVKVRDEKAFVNGYLLLK